MIKNIIAIFDFDKTITSKDTLMDFIFFGFGRFNTIIGLLFCSIPILLYLIGLIPNWRAKEFILTYFFKDMSITEFREKCNLYSLKRLPYLINQHAMDKINYHIDEGHNIIIVSASPHYWYESWATQNGINKIISTKLEIVDEKLTGKISGVNCFGIEKVNMLKEEIELSEFSYIYMYGDSKGDYDLIKISNEGYINFERVK